MTKLRGGQEKHWAEKVRVWTWYFAVKRIHQWSDNALDREFAWRSKICMSDDRPRIFEWIRRSARQPAGRDPRWKSMSELLLTVEAHPDFKGTQVLYESEFWDLLQETLVTPKLLKQRIEKSLEAHNLVRSDPITISGLSELIEKHGLGPVFDRCLKLSMRQMDGLSGLILAWSVYVQAQPTQNNEVRTVVESIVDKKLDAFFRTYHPDDKFNFYGDSLKALLQTRLDLSGSAADGYGYIETVGRWPILPKNLAGGVSEQNLFATIS